MSQTYSQIKKQIAALEAQAEAALKNELATVVAKLKETIQTYGLQPNDLFGKVRVKLGRPAKADKGTKAANSAKRIAKSGAAKAAKFADGKGNTWGGLGKRPQWLRDALEAGKQLADFAVGGAKTQTQPQPAAKASKPSVKAKAAKPAVKAAAPKAEKPATKPSAKPATKPVAKKRAGRKAANPFAKPAGAAKSAKPAVTAVPKAFPGKKTAAKKRAAAKPAQTESTAVSTSASAA